MIKLQRNLFIGDFPLSQAFANVLIIDGVDIYAQYGLKGHNGIDYALPTGTTLTSCITGLVTENYYDRDGYGNYIKIENEYCGVIYAHMKRLSEYKIGMYVVAGADIGVSGNTGMSTGPHLHFGLHPKPRNRKNGYNGYIDPLDRSQVQWVDDINAVPESEVVKGLKKELSDMRDSRNAWRDSSRNFEKALEVEQNSSKKLSDQLIAAKAALLRFNEGVIDFSLLKKRIEVRITPISGVPEGGVENG